MCVRPLSRGAAALAGPGQAPCPDPMRSPWVCCCWPTAVLPCCPGMPVAVVARPALKRLCCCCALPPLQLPRQVTIKCYSSGQANSTVEAWPGQLLACGGTCSNQTFDSTLPTRTAGGRRCWSGAPLWSWGSLLQHASRKRVVTTAESVSPMGSAAPAENATSLHLLPPKPPPSPAHAPNSQTALL